MLVCYAKLGEKRMAKKRKFLTSISLEEFHLDSLDEVIANEGGSIAEHVRRALDEYLVKKGFKKD